MGQTSFSGTPLLNAGLTAPEAGAHCDDEKLSDWAVGVRWIHTVSWGQARTFAGAFANQNVVCKLRDRQTLPVILHGSNPREILGVVVVHGHRLALVANQCPHSRLRDSSLDHLGVRKVPPAVKGDPRSLPLLL